MSGMSPQAARKLADEHEASDDELGARKGRYLRKWAHATSQAKRRAGAGMHTDAEDAWSRAEGHRQELADMGVVVPTRGELEAPASGTRKSPPGPNKPRAGAPSSASSKPRGPSRAGKSPSQIVRKAGKATGVTSSARAGWGIATSIFVGSIGLILLSRLIDKNKGGPQTVQFAASGVARLVDLVIQPVDPFASASGAALSQASEAQKQSTNPIPTTTTTTPATPALSTPSAAAPSPSSTPTK